MTVRRFLGLIAAMLLLAVALPGRAATGILTPDVDNDVFFYNFENVFDANGQYKAPGTPLVVGDHIVGIISVQNITSISGDTFYSGPQNQLSGVFAQRVEAIYPKGSDPYDPNFVEEPHVVLGPPTIHDFCRGSDCFTLNFSGDEMMALYRQSGPDTTPFHYNGPMASDVAVATDGDLWLTLGYDSVDGTYGNPDDTGYFYAHTDGVFPPPDHAFAGLNAIINNTGYALAGLNDINENEVGGTLLMNDVVLTSELEGNPYADTLGGNSPWQVRSNDPATLHPTTQAPLACRVTGGGVDTSGSWDGTLASAKGESDNGGTDRYQFGGQAGANTALPPQPKGEWTHHQQSGPDGSFVFHAGTASAPTGTAIEHIVCSDPGYCDPARPAPAKQIDFDGIGTFKNIKSSSPALANVVTEDGTGATFHWFEVHIEDLGEPGKNGKQGPAPNSCPVHGSAGTTASCDCPDFYRITIYKGYDPSTQEPDKTHVIYQVEGYLDGGNLQIHPPTGYDSP